MKFPNLSQVTARNKPKQNFICGEDPFKNLSRLAENQGDHSYVINIYIYN